MGDITTIGIGLNEEIKVVEVVSLATEVGSLRTLAVVIGANSRLMVRYVSYSLTETASEAVVEYRNGGRQWVMNSTVDDVTCSQPRVNTTNKTIEGVIEVKADCEVAIGGYRVEAMSFTAKITNFSVFGQERYQIDPAELQTNFEYKIPRFYHLNQILIPEDYLAILTKNQQDYHKEVLVYKRGHPEVWTSVYVSYEASFSYFIGKWADNVTWMIVSEEGSELTVYKIGNMSMEVLEGFESKGSLDILYSTFSRPSEVDRFSEEFEFAETLAKRTNLILVVYGGVGGFFGVVVILWCCYCWIFRLLYMCLVRRFGKREKRMLPVLRKRKGREGELMGD